MMAERRVGAILPPATGILQEAAVSAVTNQRYKRCREWFWDWILEYHYPEFMSISDLDEAAARYMEWIYISDHPFGRALSLPDALRHANPMLRGKLPFCQRAKKGLENLQKVDHHDPVPAEVAWGISVALMHLGKVAESTAILLAFHCYLRINEVVQLCTEDVIVRGDERMRERALPSISLRKGKGPGKTRLDESVILKDVVIEELLRRQIKRTKSSILFEGLTTDELRVAFYEGQKLLGIEEENRFDFHGLRGGGASHDVYVEGLSLDRAQLRGRWRSKSSFRIYIRRNRNVLAKGNLPSGDKELVTLMRQLSPEEVFGGDFGGSRFTGCE